jgi:hypothetical protein
MQAATKAAFAQHLGNIGMLFEHPASTFQIPTEEESRRKGCRQYLGVTHLTLRVFLMMQGV